MSQNIFPCLWFNGNAKEAARYYCSIFQPAYILSENPFVVMMELNGNKFMALNGGPEYTFSPATSFVISCENQQEIDYYWEKLGEAGEYGKCGWLKDKFGVSWQVVPAILGQLMADSEKAPRVMYAFMQMTKFDIKLLMAII